jgi:hypothetical protein
MSRGAAPPARGAAFSRAAMVAGLVAPLAGAACAPDYIELAASVVPDGAVAPDAGDAASLGTCRESSDCPSPADEYCAKQSCREEFGTCMAYDQIVVDEFQYLPVCGCDGITYFNDTFRQAAGVPASQGPPGLPCRPGVAVRCQGPGTCPGASVCDLRQERLGPCPSSSGPQIAPGTCWILPTTCPTPPPGDDVWTSCQGPGPGMCTGSCAAIKSQQESQRAAMCPP